MTMHPLDRPIWHALNGRLRKFSTGNDRARRMIPEAGFFAAIEDDSEENLQALGQLIKASGPVILLQAAGVPLPSGTTTRMQFEGVQMVARSITPLEPAHPIAKLAAGDAPEMLALATLTEPGPFFSRTHELGNFWGIRHEGRLVAMAGERMQLEGFTEVSGVCTHPDHRGKGYAGLLSRLVATQIQQRSETPFLHATSTNTSAIALYQKLGFEKRLDVNICVLESA